MFRLEDLRTDVRVPFRGLAVVMKKNCDCRLCQKGIERLRADGREVRGERIHVVIKPLEEYEKFQHLWIMTAKTIWSSYGAFVAALNAKLLFTPKSKDPEKAFEETRKFIEGHVFEWHPVQPAEFISEILDTPVPKNAPEGVRKVDSMWVPLRIVNEKELKDLGVIDLKKLHKEALKEWEEYLNTASAEDETDVFTF